MVEGILRCGAQWGPEKSRTSELGTLRVLGLPGLDSAGQLLRQAVDIDLQVEPVAEHTGQVHEVGVFAETEQTLILVVRITLADGHEASGEGLEQRDVPLGTVFLHLGDGFPSHVEGHTHAATLAERGQKLVGLLSGLGGRSQGLDSHHLTEGRQHSFAHLSTLGGHG